MLLGEREGIIIKQQSNCLFVDQNFKMASVSFSDQPITADDGRDSNVGHEFSETAANRPQKSAEPDSLQSRTTLPFYPSKPVLFY